VENESSAIYNDLIKSMQCPLSKVIPKRNKLSCIIISLSPLSDANDAVCISYVN
jgi:hypothetical protein